MVSAASLTVTLSTRSQMLVDTIASSSAKPGLTPEPNMVEPPRSHASTIRSRSGPRLCPVMNAAVDTTLTPADEDAHQLVGVRPHRVVDDAVRRQGEQRVDVVGGDDPQRVDAAQLADVAADLVGGPRVATDQLERRVGDDRLHRALPDVARRPLDHARACPSDVHPAVDGEDLPGDVAVLGAQERAGGGDVGGSPGPAERDRAARSTSMPGKSPAASAAPRHRGVDDARGDRVRRRCPCGPARPTGPW